MAEHTDTNVKREKSSHKKHSTKDSTDSIKVSRKTEVVEPQPASGAMKRSQSQEQQATAKPSGTETNNATSPSKATATTGKREKSTGIFGVALDDMRQVLILRPANGPAKWVPCFVWDLVEFIKTGLNSNELFSNLECLKPQVEELKQIFLREGKCNFQEVNVSPVVAADLLCLWMEQVPNGLVTLDLNSFGIAFFAKAREARILEVQSVLNALDDLRYCTLYCIFSLLFSIYSANQSIDTLLQLSEVGISLFKSAEVISIHLITIMICHFKFVFNKFPLKEVVPDVRGLTQFIVGSSVNMLFDSKTEVDDYYTVNNSQWTHDFAVNRFLRLQGQALMPVGGVRHNALTDAEIDVISDLNVISALKVLQSRRGRDWMNYDTIKKGGRRLTPWKLLRESQNAWMIQEEWRVQFKAKHGNAPTKPDEDKIKELVELAGAVDMRINDFRKIFSVYEDKQTA